MNAISTAFKTSKEEAKSLRERLANAEAERDDFKKQLVKTKEEGKAIQSALGQKDIQINEISISHRKQKDALQVIYHPCVYLCFSCERLTSQQNVLFILA